MHDARSFAPRYISARYQYLGRRRRCCLWLQKMHYLSWFARPKRHLSRSRDLDSDQSNKLKLIRADVTNEFGLASVRVNVDVASFLVQTTCIWMFYQPPTMTPCTSSNQFQAVASLDLSRFSWHHAHELIGCYRLATNLIVFNIMISGISQSYFRLKIEIHEKR